MSARSFGFVVLGPSYFFNCVSEGLFVITDFCLAHVARVVVEVRGQCEARPLIAVDFRNRRVGHQERFGCTATPGQQNNQ